MLPFLSRRIPELALLLTALLLPALAAGAQNAAEIPGQTVWSAPYTWSAFGEYSGDSSHILLGYSDKRILLALGGGFSMRLHQDRFGELDWSPEVRPLMLESDPVMTQTTLLVSDGQSPQVDNLRRGIPVLDPVNPVAAWQVQLQGGPVVNVVETAKYARRWTYAGGFSPLGFRWIFLPHSRVQPLAGLNAGFAVSPRDIPMFDTSAFNFTFSFGGGFQLWRNPTHATRIEYRFHHLSNAGIGSLDPGIDSQLIQLSYVWGWR